MRFWIRGDVNMAAPLIGTGNDCSNTHVKVGAGLALAVHAGETVDEAGDKKFSSAIDDLRVLGNLNQEARAHFGDAIVLNNDD